LNSAGEAGQTKAFMETPRIQSSLDDGST